MPGTVPSTLHQFILLNPRRKPCETGIILSLFYYTEKETQEV